jgi:hypothetical protein
LHTDSSEPASDGSSSLKFLLLIFAILRCSAQTKEWRCSAQTKEWQMILMSDVPKAITRVLVLDDTNSATYLFFPFRLMFLAVMSYFVDL